MAEDQSTRDRVRALVREVLKNASPQEQEEPAPSVNAGESRGAQPEAQSSPQARIIPLIPERPAEPAAPPVRDESGKMVITEDDVRGLEAGESLRIAEGARLTPLAADIVRDRKITLIRRVPRRGSGRVKTVAVGADHGGYRMKEELKSFLVELGHRVRDFGTDSEEAVDYPDFAHSVARAVADRTADVGIVVDGAGVGSAMAANKVPGVRAAACYSVEVARNSREHNDANVLTLGSKTIDSAAMREIVRAWLATEVGEERHRKRVAKIDAIERQYSC